MNDDWNKRSREIGGSTYEGIVEMVDDMRLASAFGNDGCGGGTYADEHERALRRLFEESGRYRLLQTDEDDPRVYWRETDDARPFDADQDAAFDTEADAMLDCLDRDGLIPSEDDARRLIEEDALSVEVRSDWEIPGNELTPAEYNILLGTGGPAMRIVGQLSEHGEPETAALEVQDWFKPWTEVSAYGTDPNDPHSYPHVVDEDVLLEYARVFYFGG